MVIHLKELEEEVKRYKSWKRDRLRDGWSRRHKHEFEVIQVLHGCCLATKKPASVVTRRCTICSYTYDEFVYV